MMKEFNARVLHGGVVQPLNADDEQDERGDEGKRRSRRSNREVVVSSQSRDGGANTVPDSLHLRLHLGLLSFSGGYKEEEEDYGKAKDQFQCHFVKKRNVIHERVKFNTHCQEKHEFVDAFVTALHILAQHCDYKNLHDEIIRDRLVAGLRDAELSERLQLDADLTMETALTKARQSETVHQQQAFLRGKEDEIPIATVNRGQTDRRQDRQDSDRRQDRRQDSDCRRKLPKMW